MQIAGLICLRNNLPTRFWRRTLNVQACVKFTVEAGISLSCGSGSQT